MLEEGRAAREINTEPPEVAESSFQKSHGRSVGGTAHDIIGVDCMLHVS